MMKITTIHQIIKLHLRIKFKIALKSQMRSKMPIMTWRKDLLNSLISLNEDVWWNWTDFILKKTFCTSIPLLYFHSNDIDFVRFKFSDGHLKWIRKDDKQRFSDFSIIFCRMVCPLSLTFCCLWGAWADVGDKRVYDRKSRLYT